MRRRSVLLTLAAVVLAAVLVVGLRQSSPTPDALDGTAPGAEALKTLLAGSPAPLARLHARPNVLLPVADLPQELAALKGYPVVVNKWASWCGPCRQEFPTFQRVSAELGRRVAFLGLNTGDYGGGAAAKFLRDFPLSYPSISDPDRKGAQKLSIDQNWPTTAFYDRAGKQVYAHQGPYVTAADLKADIRRYAGA